MNRVRLEAGVLCLALSVFALVGSVYPVGFLGTAGLGLLLMRRLGGVVVDVETGLKLAVLGLLRQDPRLISLQWDGKPTAAQ